MTNNIVFVVGAGASCDLGMPIGSALKQQVKQSLTFKFDHFNSQTSGSIKIVAELNSMYRANTIDKARFHSCFKAAEAASEGLWLAASIDNFLNAHEHNKDLVLMGKMAIVELIVEAEEKALETVWDKNTLKINVRGLENSWYAKLFRILVQEKTLENIRSVFEGITFVIFNYDRAVEFIFPHLLSAYYNVALGVAVEAFRSAKIIHPYGKIGDLYGDPSLTTGGFGRYSKSLSMLAEEINTFTEGEQDAGLSSEIDEAIAEASKIVFLGYGFIQLNNNILSRPEFKKVSRMFGTSMGISEANRKAIKSNLSSSFRSPGAYRGNLPNVEFMSWNEVPLDRIHLSAGTCSEFFDEYSLVLTSTP